MKKTICMLLVCVLCFMIVGCTSDTKTTKAETTAETTKEEESTTSAETTVAETKKLTKKEKVEKVARDYMEENFSNTDIDSITVNDDAGTDKKDDYIFLTNLTWNVQNSGKTSKEMLELYSDSLAATLAKGCKNVNEICLFWEVPYLGGNAKLAYEVRDGGAYRMDTMFDNTFN